MAYFSPTDFPFVSVFAQIPKEQQEKIVVANQTEGLDDALLVLGIIEILREKGYIK